MIFKCCCLPLDKDFVERFIWVDLWAFLHGWFDGFAGADRFVQKLKDDYDNSQREISFLNSVIVDMQKKVDDLKVSLEVSQASLLGQNITDRHLWVTDFLTKLKTYYSLNRV